MQTKKILIYFIVLFSAGLAVFFLMPLLGSVDILSKFHDWIFPFFPGTTLGLVLAIMILVLYKMEKWKTLIVCFILSGTAWFTSVKIAASISPLFINRSLFHNDYSAGFFAGIAGAIILSIIPNIVSKKIRFTALHLLAWLAGALLGVLVLNVDLDNLQIIPYAFWFSVVGTIVILNFEKINGTIISKVATVEGANNTE